MATIRGRALSTWILIALHLTLGFRALLGGGALIIDPSGGTVGVSPALLAEVPVADFLLPGIVLFLGFGVIPLGVALALYRGVDRAWLLSATVAVGLLAWVLLEGVLMGFGERLQYPNAIQAALMLLLSVSSSVRDNSHSAE